MANLEAPYEPSPWLRVYEDPSHAEQALWFATHGDPETASELVRHSDVFALHLLTEDEWTGLRAHLLRRGMVLVVEDGEAFVDWAACCIYCHQVHGPDDAGGHDQCVGAAPAGEVDPDSTDTGEMCGICFKAVCGPPFPFCCTGRARLIKKISGSGPFKACPTCHGRGAEVGCRACEGTGVAL